jgi:NADP-dependent 3-hydroxy acid dehydrogenase YdfG
VRVAVIEPGIVATELQQHLRPEVREATEKRFAGIEALQADDVAEAIRFVVTRPRRMTVNELLVRPTDQEL